MGENWIENTLTKKAISFLRTPLKLWVIMVIEPSTVRGHLSQGPFRRGLLFFFFFKSTNKKGKNCCSTDVQSWLIYDKGPTTENQCFDIFQIPIIKSQHKSFTRRQKKKWEACFVERCSVMQTWQTQLIVQLGLITHLHDFLKGKTQCFELLLVVYDSLYKVWL